MTERGGAQASLVAFDLLRLEGDGTCLHPLEARREELIMTALVPSQRNML
jgi:ATP-dependent DNA ligase